MAELEFETKLVKLSLSPLPVYMAEQKLEPMFTLSWPSDCTRLSSWKCSAFVTETSLWKMGSFNYELLFLNAPMITRLEKIEDAWHLLNKNYYLLSTYASNI